MLVLSRGQDEKVVARVSTEDLRELLLAAESAGEQTVNLVTVTVVKTGTKLVRLGFDAARCIDLARTELAPQPKQEHR